MIGSKIREPTDIGSGAFDSLPRCCENKITVDTANLTLTEVIENLVDPIYVAAAPNSLPCVFGKTLDTYGNSVDTTVQKDFDLVPGQRQRIAFTGEFAIILQAEIPADHCHQAQQLARGEMRRRTAAEVDRCQRTTACTQHIEFRLESIEKTSAQTAICSLDREEGAIVTLVRTERQVHIDI